MNFYNLGARLKDQFESLKFMSRGWFKDKLKSPNQLFLYTSVRKKLKLQLKQDVCCLKHCFGTKELNHT